ncbi:hypothetical protein [Bradyrhizobium sp. USDA 4506]
MVKITRREFLGSSTAALAFGSASASAPLIIESTTGGLLVSEGNHLRWLVESRSFGPSAVVSKTSETSIGIRQLSLSANLETSVDLNFEKSDAGWTLHCIWQDFGQSRANLTFARFLHGEPLALPLDASSHAIFSNATGLKLPVQTKLELHRNSSVVLRPSRGTLSTLGDTFKPSALLIGPRPKDASGWRGEYLAPFTSRTVRLGAARDVSVTLDLDPRARLFLYGGAHPVRIIGDLVLRLKGRQETLAAPIAQAEFNQDGARRSTTLACDLSHWPFRSRVGTFDLSGDDDGQPFKVSLTSTADAITSFDMPTLLFNHNIAIQGSDRTRLDFVDQKDRTVFNRLDFKGANFKIFLPGLRRNPNEFGYEFGAATKTVRLPLDDAKLRIARSRDLMSLEFRFKNIDLELRNGKPYLVGRKIEGANPERVLVVDLPPQHIMERAFLRQQFDLPDSAPNIVASDLARLRSSSLEDVLRLRRQIRDSKIAAEKSDPGNAGLTPFADFSALWDADPEKKVPPREKFWIGPLGLVSVPGRQAARQILAKGRRSAIDQVLQDLGKDRSPADTDKDIEKAVGLIPLPPVGVDIRKQKEIATRERDPGKFFAALFAEARIDRFNHDLFEVLKSWDLKHKDVLLILPNWPLRQKDWQALFPGVSPPVVSRAFAKEFLTVQLKESLQKSSEDATTGVDCSRKCETPEGLSLPVEARMSGASRLAFDFEAKELALTVENLTDWRSFNLKVVRQAHRLYKAQDPKQSKLEPQDDPAEILRYHGITGRAELWNSAHRLAEIRQAIARPSDYETSLEVPSRLILSPSQDARWKTTRHLPAHLDFWKPPSGSPTLIWQARLHEALPTPSLRAIWSPDYQPGVFKTDGRERSPPLGPWAPWDLKSHKNDESKARRFRTALDSADRHELVILSSVPGLPVVGIPPSDKGSDKKDTSQVGPPAGYGLSDIWTEIIPGSGKTGADTSAIYLPRPLTTNRLLLGSLGATLDLDTTFEPPSAASIDADGKRTQKMPLYESFSIERWRSIIVDGRDVVTTIVRRGYLFPLGHKAALVKLTEPRIRLAVTDDPASGYIVEQAQRFFIEVSRDQQLYPATGQLFSGRGFPAKRVKLLTLRTPDLLDPTEEILGRVGTANDGLKTRLRGNVVGAVSDGAGQQERALSGLVFWPRTDAGPAGSVRFRMLIDDSASAVSMPLLFVDNRAANDPRTVEALCKRYYSDKTDPTDPKPFQHDLIAHNGVARKYADEQEPGQCTFNTDWQQVAAEGRPGFDFDGPLQAATQPPFYPSLSVAQIRSQQIEGLKGSPAPPITVTYNKEYVRQGFGSTAREQTFLDAVPFDFDMGDKGDRSGGIGRMALRVVGFNRQLGPVGSSPDKAARALMEVPPRVRFADASTTRSDAGSGVSRATSTADFVGNFFPPGAKLLGLIEFRQFVLIAIALMGENVLPKLQEVSQFAIPKNEIAAIFDDEKGVLKSLIADLKNRIDKIGRSVFADLSNALDEMEAARSAVSGLNRTAQPNADQLAIELSRTWSSGRRVLHALDEISRAPLASVAEDIRQSINDFQARISSDRLRELDPARIIRSAVAAKIAEATRNANAWSDAILYANADPARKILQDLKDDKERWAAIWTAPDPVAKLLADPLFADLSNEAREELTRTIAGPLYAEIRQVLDAINKLADAGLDKGAQHIDEAINAIISAALRFQAVVQKANSVCSSGITTVRDIIQAVLPDLGTCPAPAIHVLAEPTGRATCRVLQDAIAQMNSSLQAITTAAAGREAQLGAFRNYAEALVAAATKNLQSFQDAVNQLTAARTALLQQLTAGACLAPTTTVARLLSQLRHMRDQLASLSLSVPVIALPPPRGAIPSDIKAEWDKLTASYVTASAAWLDFSREITIAGAESGARKNALERVRTHILSNLMGDEPDPNRVISSIQSDVISRSATLKTQLEEFSSATGLGLEDVRSRVTELEKNYKALLQAALTNEAEILRRALREAIANLLPAELQSLLNTVLKEGAKSVASLYDDIRAVRKLVLAKATQLNPVAETFFGLPPCSTGWAESILVVQKGDGTCSADDDELVKEAQTANAAAKAIEAKASLNRADAIPFQNLLKLWQSGQSAPQKITTQVNDFLAHGARARLQQLIDVDSVRHSFEDQLRNLVPARKTLTSTLTLPLSKVTVASFVTFEPHGSKPVLDLRSNVTTHFDQAKVTAIFSGRVDPFKLEIPEIITVDFKKGITYSGGSGQTGQLLAPLDTNNIVFGKILSFLAELAKWLSIGGDNGPFTRLSLVNPAIEAGYRIAIPVITVGVTFTNINFFGSMLLPLEDKPARVRFSLGSLDSPFMISAGIYGGTGYFGLEGSAKGIEAFDSACEFGGIASIGYGPLQGTAYVTSGVYVRQTANSCDLGGIFSAGFTAHIACFSISAAFTLRMVRQGNGALEGEATLTFSFSVGLARVSYSAQAKRNMGAGFQGGGNAATASLAPSSLVRLADASGDIARASWCRTDDLHHAELAVIGVSAGDNWGLHSTYFDVELAPSPMDLT